MIDLSVEKGKEDIPDILRPLFTEKKKYSIR